MFVEKTDGKNESKHLKSISLKHYYSGNDSKFNQLIMIFDQTAKNLLVYHQCESLAKMPLGFSLREDFDQQSLKFVSTIT